MIADVVYNSDAPPTLYLRWRDESGLVEQNVNDNQPYFYVPSATPDGSFKNMKRSYPESHVVEGKTFEGL